VEDVAASKGEGVLAVVLWGVGAWIGGEGWTNREPGRPFRRRDVRCLRMETGFVEVVAVGPLRGEVEDGLVGSGFGGLVAIVFGRDEACGSVFVVGGIRLDMEIDGVRLQT